MGLLSLARSRLVFAIVGLVYFSTGSAGADSDSTCDSTKEARFISTSSGDSSGQSTESRCPRISNWNHPKYYTSLFEITPDGKKRTLLDAKQLRADETTDSTVDYEIDVRSKLVVEFDREWIWDHRDVIDLNISIRAELKGNPLLVPGYPIGRETFRLSRYSSQAIGFLNGFFDLNKELRQLLQDLKLIDAKYERIDGPRGFETAYEEFLSSPGDEKFLAVIDSARFRHGRIREFLAMWPDISTILPAIHEDSLSWFVPILARLTDNHPTRIVSAAKTITDTHIVRLKEIDRDLNKIILQSPLTAATEELRRSVAAETRELYAEQELLVRSMRAGLRNLLNRYKNWTYVGETSVEAIALRNTVNELVLGSLKDVDFIIANTPANVDDIIQVQILNGGTGYDDQVVLPIRLTVRRFGVQKSLKESFMFFYRMHVHTPREADSANPAFSDPTPVNFEPYPGLSLIWSWYGRRGEFTKHLTPGIGFNVSFPRFGTSISEYRFNPGSSTGEVTTDAEGDIGVCVGGVVTLFDGAFQLSRGWMLTVEEEREYWSIGFNFLKAVKGVKAVADKVL